MKVAAIQMCSSASVADNLVVAKGMIAQAAQQGAKLIVFPEMFALMGKNEHDKVTIKELLGKGNIQSFIAEEASNKNVWIVAGTIPIANDHPNKVNASSLFFNNKGELVARYDKIHLYDVELSPQEIYRESQTTEPGNRITVVDTPFGKIGMSVCYDLRFPELFRCMVNQGAQIFIAPSAFTARTGAMHWELLLRARAVENLSYIIGAAQGGLHASGRRTYGNSMIIDPWGKILAKQEGTEPGIIYADIDLEQLNSMRNSFPALNHQKIFFSVC